MCFSFLRIVSALSFLPLDTTSNKTLNVRTIVSHNFCVPLLWQHIEDCLQVVARWSSAAVLHTSNEPANDFDANIFRVHFRRSFNDPIFSEAQYRKTVRENIYNVLGEVSGSGRILMQCDDPTNRQCEEFDLIRAQFEEQRIIIVSWKLLIWQQNSISVMGLRCERSFESLSSDLHI